VREAEDLIERERNNRGVVLFFFNSELIGRRDKPREMTESNEDRVRELWPYDQADWSPPPTAVKERNNYVWSRAVLQCCLQLLSNKYSVYFISLCLK